MNIERICRRQDEGGSTKKHVNNNTKLFAKNCPNTDDNQLGKGGLEVLKQHRIDKKRFEKEKLDRLRKEWENSTCSTAAFLSTGKFESIWNAKDHALILRLLCREKSKKTKKRKSEFSNFAPNVKKGGQ